MRGRQWRASFCFIRRLVVGWTLVYVAVCLLAGGSPYARLVVSIAALTWFGLLCLLSWRPHFSVQHPFWRSAELVLSNLALTLLLGEASLRLCATLLGPTLLAQDALSAYGLAHGRDYGHGLVTNSLGYPGRDHPREKPTGIFRIAALGDSFAVGPAVAYADNYLALLEHRLSRTEVLNFGVSGAGPREYFAVLERDVWLFQPDLVLVSIFVGNDITESLATPRHLAPEGHALYQLCHRGWRLVCEGQRQGALPIAGDRLARPPLSHETYAEVEARRLQICQTPVPEATEKKWRRALGHLNKLVAACRAHGTEVRFVLIPDEFQVNPSVLELAVRHAGIDRQQIDVDLPQRRLADFCVKHDVPCLDLLPAFRGRSDLYAPQDTHWNKAGNHLAAEQIGSWLDVGYHVDSRAK